MDVIGELCNVQGRRFLIVSAVGWVNGNCLLRSIAMDMLLFRVPVDAAAGAFKGRVFLCCAFLRPPSCTHVPSSFPFYVLPQPILSSSKL